MSVVEWFAAVEGTAQGARIAMILALMSAVFHAIFGALQNGRYNPWMMRGVIDVNSALIALPLALFVVPWPTRDLWIIMVGVFFIHTIYKILLAKAYTRGAFTAVYPIMRGTGPLATVIFAGFVFGETFTPTQWAGVACLSGGIFALAVYNVSKAGLDRSTLMAGIAFAAATGVFVAIYTTYDAYGIRLAPNPFTFVVWFFIVDSLVFPLLAYRMWVRDPTPPRFWPMMRWGFFGSCLAFLSFGAVMLATRLDKVGEAAVLRETSVIFAALIGWVILKEPVGPRRLGIIAVIALGAVIVEFGA